MGSGHASQRYNINREGGVDVDRSPFRPTLFFRQEGYVTPTRNEVRPASSSVVAQPMPANMVSIGEPLSVRRTGNGDETTISEARGWWHGSLSHIEIRPLAACPGADSRRHAPARRHPEIRDAVAHSTGDAAGWEQSHH